MTPEKGPPLTSTASPSRRIAKAPSANAGSVLRRRRIPSPALTASRKRLAACGCSASPSMIMGLLSGSDCRMSAYQARGFDTRATEGSGEAPGGDRLGIAAHGDRPERRSLADRVPRRLAHRVGDDELRSHFLVEALEARGQVHRVADDRIFLAPRRTDGSRHRLADVDADAEPDRPGVAGIACADGAQHLARRQNGVRG